jgi:glycosyltransferase involved in cell wall biosynthesis
VLIAAFACHPGAGENPVVGGGEALLGWNLVRQIGRYHDVWVMTCGEDQRGIEAALEQERLDSIRVRYLDLPRILKPLIRLPGGIQLYAYLWQMKAYLASRTLHKTIHFDLFHHVTYANDWMASFIGALLPIPYIRGPSGGAHRTPHGLLSEYSLIGRAAEWLRAIGQWLFRHDPFFILGQRRARAILVCNRDAMEAIPRKWRRKTQLFPVNGISSSDLSWAVPQEGDGQQFRVLSAGKLLRIKGFGLAIRAFRAFADRYPGAEFTIVGDGPELPRLEAMVRQLGLQARVRFERWMARQELFSKMRTCDVFLFPSLRDGGGAVVVEAMAAGKPVICLDAGGPGMHVTNECGIKVCPHSPGQVVTELAAALETLYSNKELRCRMGEAARARAKEVYCWDRLGERLLEIYQQALGVRVFQGDGKL